MHKYEHILARKSNFPTMGLFLIVHFINNRLVWNIFVYNFQYTA